MKEFKWSESASIRPCGPALFNKFSISSLISFCFVPESRKKRICIFRQFFGFFFRASESSLPNFYQHKYRRTSFSKKMFFVWDVIKSRMTSPSTVLNESWSLEAFCALLRALLKFWARKYLFWVISVDFGVMKNTIDWIYDIFFLISINNFYKGDN